jgi:Tfp pilus assembly protein PilF
MQGFAMIAMIKTLFVSASKRCLIGAALAILGGLVLAADTSSAPVSAAPDPMASARSAIQAKDWKKAIAELNAAVKAEPKNADAHNLLAYSNRKQAQPNLLKAFEHYKIALQLDPKHKGAHEYIGEAYLMDKKPEEAEKHLATLEKLCGNKTCEEYVDLSKSLAAYRANNK